MPSFGFMLQHDGKEDPKQGWYKNTDLLHSTLDVKSFWCWTVEENSPLHVIMKRSDDAKEPTLSTDLLEKLEKAVSADQVKGLREIYEGNEEWLPLFPAFLL